MLQDYTHPLIPLCTQADQLFDVCLFNTNCVTHIVYIQCTFYRQGWFRIKFNYSWCTNHYRCTISRWSVCHNCGVWTHVLHKRIKTVVQILQCWVLLMCWAWSRVLIRLPSWQRFPGWGIRTPLSTCSPRLLSCGRRHNMISSAITSAIRCAIKCAVTELTSSFVGHFDRSWNMKEWLHVKKSIQRSTMEFDVRAKASTSAF